MLLIQRIFNFDISQDMRKAFVLFFFFIKQPNSRAGRMWHLATHGFEAAQVASKNELAKNRIGQRRHDWRFDCPAAYAEIHIEKRSLVLMSH